MTTTALTRSQAAPRPGIVHLGLGAFFRAHGTQVIAEAMRVAGGDWGIVGASLRSSGIRDRLAAQGFVYTAVEMSPEGETRRVVDALSDVLFAPENPQALVARMADPATRIGSLTVTEKGYCHIPSTGALDAEHPDIVHDIAHPEPRSAIGFIVRALQARHRAGLPPFTVLSCDNLPDNGRVAHAVVTGLARRIDPALADWIARDGAFPSSMVDRIVPATTDEGVARLARDAGYHDAAPVFHEPFLQWVIEDRFVEGARPTFERVPGVQMVESVAPFEHMKIRMLNGTHSALAYLGYLAGYETISETVADPAFRAFVRRLWADEIIPTLTPPEGVDLAAYADALLERYSNPAIHHRTWQIAMDGSQKLPQRLLGTIDEALAAGRSCPGLCLAVAAWMRYVGGVDEQGGTIDVRDPLAERLRAASEQAASPSAAVDALFAMREVFGDAVSHALRSATQTAYAKLINQGAKATVADAY